VTICNAKPTAATSQPQGGQQQHVKIVIAVPSLCSMADVMLDVTPHTLSFVAPAKYALEMELPVRVENADAGASFSKKKGEVRVTVPVAAAL
jgi:hypothetical protein